VPHNDKLRQAVSYLLEWVADGRRLSELPKDKRKLYNYCIKAGYLSEYPLPHDRLINRTGRKP
jgi:hypothetical protein